VPSTQNPAAPISTKRHTLLLTHRFLLRVEQKVDGEIDGVGVLDSTCSTVEGASEGQAVGDSVGGYVPATHASSSPDPTRTQIGLFVHFFLFSDGQ